MKSRSTCGIKVDLWTLDRDFKTLRIIRFPLQNHQNFIWPGNLGLLVESRLTCGIKVDLWNLDLLVESRLTFGL